MLYFYFFFMFFFATPALAFRLDPMVQEIGIRAPFASATYTVENNTKNKVAVQFDIRKRIVDVNGKEERPEATGFLIYPEQMALEPGEKRNVRLTWTGDSMPNTELPFRFVASQLPVDFGGKDKNSANDVKLKFLVEYVASLYLVPPRVKPKMRLLSQSLDGKGNVEILVANEGTAHHLLERMEILLKSEGKQLAISGAALKELRAENILPGSKRLLRFPLPKELSKDVSVSVNFDP